MSTSQTRPQSPAHPSLSTYSPTPTSSASSTAAGLHDTTKDSLRRPIVIGGVTVTGPNAKGYYRLKWHEPDGTLGDTSGSRDEAYARLKAHDINTRLTQAAGPKATTPLTQVVAAFLAEGRSPYKEKRTYKQAQLDGLRCKLTRGLRGLEHVRAMDLDRRLCDVIRSQAGTRTGVVENTNALRALLHWGYQDGYFTAAQVELLPRSSATPQPVHKTTRTIAAGDRRVQRARKVGQAETYIEDEDCPNDAQIEALAKALDEHFPRWGALACELAANTGMRWGEQFQLTATDVHLDGCLRYRSPHIHINRQIASTRKAGKDGTGDQRDLPKGRKTRVVPIPRRSIRPPPTATWTNLALSQLSWLGAPLAVAQDSEAFGTALDLQDEMAAENPLEHDNEHWGESVIIALGKHVTTRDVIMLSEDYNARVAANRHHVTSMSLAKLMRHMVLDEHRTADQAKAFTRALIRCDRWKTNAAITAQDFIDGRISGRMGRP